MSISLKVITLFNFKSFRGKIVIDNFESFTAIIGPNGSGKSNIMDAINFVLGGKLSALRVKHLNELIHEAYIRQSAIKGPYVTIVFIGDHNKEKSFTRMIQWRGGSQYKIDDEIVDSNFYMTELKEFGLDIKASNFLMPQGYIQYFATRNMPKELTMLLEEISGSNIYKADYERLQLEFLKVRQEIHFVYQTRKDKLRQKKSVMTEEIEAEKYLQLQKQYMEEKTKFQFIQLIFMKKVIEFLQNEQKEIKLQVDEHLQSKETAMSLLKHTKLKVKPLFDSLNTFEESILQLESNIQKKKLQNVNLEDHILYWQKKCDCARTSLDSANNAYDTHKTAVQELTNELEKISKKLAELGITSPENIVELDNFQVNRYMILKTEVESRAKDSINRINELMHDQQIDQYKLDNENRRKMELESKAKFEMLEKEKFEIRLQKLQTLNDQFKSRLVEKISERQTLQREISEAQEKSSNLGNDITMISEKLIQADINNEKKAAIIKNLKESFSGVHDRLFNLCKPIHSRYNVAVTKVFGKNMEAIVVDTERTAKQCISVLKEYKMGIETFLPLDIINSKPVNNRLRAELEQTNFKLLFDVLKISSTQIDKAVLYVTKNTLVCETAIEASKKAFESDAKYDCVSLDGCFFHKSGIISGGFSDLIVKAKQWENIQSSSNISVLKEQKEQLKQKLKNLPKISRMQSDFDIINKDINQLIARNEVIEKDIQDTTKEIQIQNRKLNDLNENLSLQDLAISVIQHEIQKRNQEIKIIEEDVNKIKNKVFVDFCKENNVPDITYYEKNLCSYKEQINKQMEIVNRKNYIENQLRFENEFNRVTEFKDKILKCKCAVEEADAEYNKACEQVQDIRIAIEQKETRLLHLKNERTIIEKNLEDVEEELVQCRSRIGIISKSYLESQKAYMAMWSKIEQKKAECDTILKECKLKGITIPMLSETLHEGQEDLSSSNSYLSAKSSSVWEIIMNIDFSQISEDIRNNSTDDLQDIIRHSDKKLIEIQSELKTIQKPNLKAHEKVDLIVQQIKEIQEKLHTLRTESNNIEREFKIVKAKRHKLFSDCLECIAAEIDSIYKNLVDDMSAQVFITPDNPEEPYTGGINYNCIPPSKRIQPIQYLSDGEKSLANLALLFAILRYKPTPFFIMDEGDAALDNANIKKVVRFVRSQMNNMQFIAITLNKRLSFCADTLLGVTTEPERPYPESVIFAVELKQVESTKNMKTFIADN